MYADVIVDISLEKLDKSFQYHVPEELCGKLTAGMTVRVPFGRGNREISGYVIRLTQVPVFDPEKMKDLLAIETGMETIESKLIALAAWIRNRYGSTMNLALKTVLPVKTKVAAKQKKRIVLNVPVEEAARALEEARKKSYKGRVRLLELLLDRQSVEYTEALKQHKLSAAIIRPVEQAGLIRIEYDRVYRGELWSTGEVAKKERPRANAEQQTVLDGIRLEMQQTRRPCLIHGVTGSGKTLVYMELIQDILDRKEQAIVLIPEIALTYQIVRRFYEYFGEKVSVLHSQMTPAERYDQMEQAKSGRVQVMVGPRSALFTPFPKLGLIIIDEEHEGSYQSESMPRYHAREVAVQRGKMEQAQVVLGSATPSVDAYDRAKRGEYALFTLQHRYGNRAMAHTEVIDMRKELQGGNRSILSRRLHAAIAKRLEKKEQMMLFLNRRGYAGFVSCRSCGYVAKCPHCDVSMTIHNHGRLICHYCGYETKVYQKCPSCDSPFIGGFQAGTQQIEQLVQKEFPDSRILRMDYDTTRHKDDYSRILTAFANREADILIGTQMIVKGHDFPGVTLVGVLAADLSLNSNDFRSAERTFQLLTQAVGRSGRGELPGEAFVQTYQPEHYSIQSAVAQDYLVFYEEEMSYRSMMGYPPAGGMLCIHGACEDELLLTQGMDYIREYILRLDPKHQLGLIGPAPESVGKIQDSYRKVLYVKHREENVLTALKNRLEEYIKINGGFAKIMIQFERS